MEGSRPPSFSIVGFHAGKLRDHFAAGTRLVWIVDRRTHSARAFTAPDQPETIDEDGVLDGRDVLPGFTMSLRELFAELERAKP